jgi:hemoglobin
MHLTDGPPDLRTRLGGEEALSAIVDNFYLRVTGDALVAPVFARVDLPALRLHQQQFLNTVIDAPTEPTAAHLRTAHQELQITPRQFAALVQHLQAALREAGVPDAVMTELIQTVEQYADDVIGR